MTFGKKLTGLIVLLFLGGCWSAPPPRAEDAPKSPPAAEAPKPKPFVHELGSLWSPDSRWNNMFAVAPLRSVGDVLSLKLTDPVLAMITGTIPREPIKRGAKKDAKKDGSKGGKESAAEPKQDSGGGETKDDTLTVEAVIKEILPNGIFLLSVYQTVTIGSNHPTIILEGKVHERDIATDESLSTDAMFNVSVKLAPTFTDQLKRLANGEPPLQPQPPMLKAEEKQPKAEEKK